VAHHDRDWREVCAAMIDSASTTPDQYRALAAEFRAKARNQESPAFRAELEDVARCYEWAAESLRRHTKD